MVATTRRFFARLLAVAGAVFWGPPVAAFEVERIEAPELKRLWDKGEAVIIDVRSKAAWDVGHVEGAIHIPLDQVEARLKELPKNKLVAAYCT